MHGGRPRWASIVALLVFAGCQSPPDVSAEIDEHADLINESRTAACACPEDVGHASLSECVEALGSVGVEDRDCMREVVAGQEEEAKAFLDCANGALQNYVGCLEANPGCEAGWYDDCTVDYQDERAACPQLSGSGESFAACAL